MDQITRIDARAAAFAYEVMKMLTRPVTFIAQSEIEAATLMDHTRWPLDGIERWGLVQVSSGASDDVQGAAGWGRTERPHSSSATYPYVVQEAACTASTSSTDVDCAGDLSALVPPSSDVWRGLGRYRFDGWLLHCLALDEIVTTATVRQVLGMDERTARRFVARLKAERFLDDEGRLSRYRIETFHDDGDLKARQDAKRGRRQRWLDDHAARTVLSTTLKNGFRRLAEEAVQEALAEPEPEPVDDELAALGRAVLQTVLSNPA